MTNPLERLVEELRRLPGVGAKSARRLAYHLIEADAEDVQRLVETILAAKEATHRCSQCFNLSAQDPCEFCASSKRDRSMIDYKGLYHVLEGALSPIDGVGVEDIRLKELMLRLQDNTVQEVIIATDPDVEGEATALYIARLLQPTGIKVTRIARGIPVGGDIEYADEVTLSGAVLHRQEMR